MIFNFTKMSLWVRYALCRAGLHNWNYFTLPGEYEQYTTRLCVGCGKQENRGDIWGHRWALVTESRPPQT